MENVRKRQLDCEPVIDDCDEMNDGGDDGMMEDV